MRRVVTRCFFGLWQRRPSFDDWPEFFAAQADWLFYRRSMSTVSGFSRSLNLALFFLIRVVRCPLFAQEDILARFAR